MSKSTALARIPEPDRKPDPEAEKIPAVTSLAVPSALLLAAEAVCAKAGEARPMLAGVYLHAKGDRGRVVGSDGVRMFIASFDLPGKVPPWMRSGVVLSGEALRSRVQMLGKLSEEKQVLVSHAKGNATAELSDQNGETVFKVKTLSGDYPNYEAAIGGKSFSDLDEDGNPVIRDWQPVGINSSYLKQCGDIAKTLEAGLDKSERSASGMVVRAFNGGEADAPLVFDFSTWPGAVLIVAAAVAPKTTSKETTAILAPAVKATVAALRAHATRWDQQAAQLTNEGDKAAATAKAEAFRQRVGQILGQLPAEPALKHDKPEPEAAATAAAPAADEAKTPDPEPAADDSHRPATKRTKIKVPTQQSAANGSATA